MSAAPRAAARPRPAATAWRAPASVPRHPASCVRGPFRPFVGDASGAWAKLSTEQHFGRVKLQPSARAQGRAPGPIPVFGVAPAARPGRRDRCVRPGDPAPPVSDLTNGRPGAGAGRARCPASAHLLGRALPQRSRVTAVLPGSSEHSRAALLAASAACSQSVKAKRSWNRRRATESPCPSPPDVPSLSASNRAQARSRHRPSVTESTDFFGVGLHVERGIAVADQPRRRGDPDLCPRARAQLRRVDFEAARSQQNLLFAVATELPRAPAPRTSQLAPARGMLDRRSSHLRRGR